MVITSASVGSPGEVRRAIGADGMNEKPEYKLVTETTLHALRCCMSCGATVCVTDIDRHDAFHELIRLLDKDR